MQTRVNRKLTGNFTGKRLRQSKTARKGPATAYQARPTAGKDHTAPRRPALHRRRTNPQRNLRPRARPGPPPTTVGSRASDVLRHHKSGGRGIRTHGDAERLTGFQDRRHRPLGEPSRNRPPSLPDRRGRAPSGPCHPYPPRSWSCGCLFADSVRFQATTTPRSRRSWAVVSWRCR